MGQLMSPLAFHLFDEDSASVCFDPTRDAAPDDRQARRPPSVHTIANRNGHWPGPPPVNRASVRADSEACAAGNSPRLPMRPASASKRPTAGRIGSITLPPNRYRNARDTPSRVPHGGGQHSGDHRETHLRWCLPGRGSRRSGPVLRGIAYGTSSLVEPAEARAEATVSGTGISTARCSRGGEGAGEFPGILDTCPTEVTKTQTRRCLLVYGFDHGRIIPIVFPAGMWAGGTPRSCRSECETGGMSWGFEYPGWRGPPAAVKSQPGLNKITRK